LITFPSALTVGSAFVIVFVALAECVISLVS
jgi:hypothetical protein